MCLVGVPSQVRQSATEQAVEFLYAEIEFQERAGSQIEFGNQSTVFMCSVGVPSQVRQSATEKAVELLYGAPGKEAPAKSPVFPTRSKIAFHSFPPRSYPLVPKLYSSRSRPARSQIPLTYTGN